MPSITPNSNSDNAADAEPECNRMQIFQTKTRLTPKPKKELDIRSISSLEDLKSLKRSDPFMYYSIPAVHSAKILMKNDNDIDTSNLGVSKIRRSYMSCPSRMQPTTNRHQHRLSGRHNEDWDSPSPNKAPRLQESQQEEEEHHPSSSTETEQVIRRSTRISCECGPSLLLDDILEGVDDLNMGGDYSLEDRFDAIFALAGQKK